MSPTRALVASSCGPLSGITVTIAVVPSGSRVGCA
jgi:hypothetical protein